MHLRSISSQWNLFSNDYGLPNNSSLASPLHIFQRLNALLAIGILLYLDNVLFKNSSHPQSDLFMRISSGLITTTLLATVFSALMTMTACNRSAVALQYTNAKDEVPPLGNLIFRF